MVMFFIQGKVRHGLGEYSVSPAAEHYAQGMFEQEKVL